MGRKARNARRPQRATNTRAARTTTKASALLELTQNRNQLLDLTETQTRLVSLARRAGASWTEIAKALDVTQQAAHQRFRRDEKSTSAGLSDGTHEPPTKGLAGPPRDFPADEEQSQGATATLTATSGTHTAPRTPPGVPTRAGGF